MFREWGCFSTFIGEASRAELRRGSLIHIESDWTTMCAPYEVLGFFLLSNILGLCESVWLVFIPLFLCYLVGNLFQY